MFAQQLLGSCWKTFLHKNPISFLDQYANQTVANTKFVFLVDTWAHFLKLPGKMSQDRHWKGPAGQCRVVWWEGCASEKRSQADKRPWDAASLELSRTVVAESHRLLLPSALPWAATYPLYPAPQMTLETNNYSSVAPHPTFIFYPAWNGPLCLTCGL